MGTLDPPRRRWRKLKQLGWGLLAFCVTLNCMAYFQARSLTMFSSGGVRAPKPEEMSAGQKLWYGLTGIPVPRPENGKTPADYHLGFSTFNSQTSDGKRIQSWSIPADGTARGTILALHGYGESKAKVLPEAAIFHELQYQVVVVDFRGSGGSDGDYTTLGIEEQLDIEAVWESLADFPQPIVIYGRSMGSVAAIRAIAAGKVTPVAVILESPFDRLSMAICRRCDLAGAPRFPTAELLLFWGGVQHGFNAFDHNPVELASRVNCPAVLFRGERDTRVAAEDIDSIAAALPHGKGVVTFPAATHDGCSRPSRERFRDEVEQFVSELHLAE